MSSLTYDEFYQSIYPVVALQSHGSLSGWWIHKEYKTYKVVAKYYYPYNPKTAFQQSWRDVFASAISNWQGFNPATKNFYNTLLGPGVMSGYNRYLGMYLDANYPPEVMKILQKIMIISSQISTYGEDYYDPLFRFLFDPFLYTGVQHIYFKMLASVDDVESSGYIALYDFTHDEIIEEFEITSETPSWFTSVDLKDILTSETLIGIKIKGGDEEGEYEVKALFAFLDIEQETYLTGKKSATYFKLSRYGTISPLLPWYDANSSFIKVDIDSFDGTVKAYFEAYLRALSGGTMKARLYDITADEVVADSEVETSETTTTRVISDELELVDGHVYKFQYDSQEGGKTGYFFGAYIKITAEDFTKIVCIPFLLPSAYCKSTAGVWASKGYQLPFEISKLSYDSISIEYQVYSEDFYSGTKDKGLRLRNVTDDDVLEETENVFSVSGSVRSSFQDIISTPDGDDTFEFQSYNDVGGWVRLAIFAVSLEKV